MQEGEVRASALSYLAGWQLVLCPGILPLNELSQWTFYSIEWNFAAAKLLILGVPLIPGMGREGHASHFLQVVPEHPFLSPGYPMVSLQPLPAVMVSFSLEGPKNSPSLPPPAPTPCPNSASAALAASIRVLQVCSKNCLSTSLTSQTGSGTDPHVHGQLEPSGASSSPPAAGNLPRSLLSTWTFG